jgi:hypothetical protein
VGWWGDEQRSALRACGAERLRMRDTAERCHEIIVNRRDRVPEVHLEPAQDAYQRIDTLRPGQRLSPVSAPDRSVHGADLIP